MTYPARPSANVQPHLQQQHYSSQQGYYPHAPHQPIGFYPVYPAPQQWPPPPPSRPPPPPSKSPDAIHKSPYANHPVSLASLPYHYEAFNAHGYYPGPDFRFSAGNAPKSPSKAVTIKSPPLVMEEQKGLGLTMGPAAEKGLERSTTKDSAPEKSSAAESIKERTLTEHEAAPVLTSGGSTTTSVTTSTSIETPTAAHDAAPNGAHNQAASSEETAEKAANAPPGVPLADEQFDDMMGYEPLKPNTITGTSSSRSSPPLNAAQKEDVKEDGTPWYLQPVTKADPGSSPASLAIGMARQQPSLHSPAEPMAIIKKGPITAWLSVKSEIEDFIQQLVADNEHYASANDKLVQDADNWKSACLLAQRQRDTLQRQLVNATSHNPQGFLAIASPPLVMADGLDRPLSPKRLSNASFFDSVLMNEPNIGAPLVKITQVEAEANERRTMEVEKLEREMEAQETEMLEIRKELAEAKETLRDIEEEQKTTYAAILLHADITMFDYKLVREGRSGGVDTAINISASIYELCGKVLPDGECPDVFSLMIFMDRARIADELVAHGIISSTNTFDAFCDGIAETHGLFVVIDVSGEEDALGKVKEHFKWHVNISACTLLYLATSRIFDFTSLLQLYREEEKLDKVYTADLPELHETTSTFPIKPEQLHHIKLLFPEQKSPSEVAATITAGVQAKFGRTMPTNGSIADFPTLVSDGSMLGSNSPCSSPTSTTTELPTRRDVFDSSALQAKEHRGQQRKREAGDGEPLSLSNRHAYVPPVKRNRQQALEKDWRTVQPKVVKLDPASQSSQTFKQAMGSDLKGEAGMKNAKFKNKRSAQVKAKPSIRPQYQVPNQAEQWPVTPAATQTAILPPLPIEQVVAVPQHPAPATQPPQQLSNQQPLQGNPAQQVDSAQQPLTQNGFQHASSQAGLGSWPQNSASQLPVQNLLANTQWQHQAQVQSTPSQAHPLHSQHVVQSIQQPIQQYQPAPQQLTSFPATSIQQTSSQQQQQGSQQHGSRQPVNQQPQQQQFTHTQQPMQQYTLEQQPGLPLHGQVNQSAPPAQVYAQVHGQQQYYAPVLDPQQQATQVQSAPQAGHSLQQHQALLLHQDLPPQQSAIAYEAQPQQQYQQQYQSQPHQQFQQQQQQHRYPNGAQLHQQAGHQQPQTNAAFQQPSSQQHQQVQQPEAFAVRQEQPVAPLAPPVHPSRQHLVSFTELPRPAASMSFAPPGLPPPVQSHPHFDYRPAPSGQQASMSYQVIELPPLPPHATPALQAKVVELNDGEEDGLKPFEVAFRPGESVCGSEHSSPDLPARKVSGPVRAIRHLALPGPALPVSVSMKRTITVNNSGTQNNTQPRDEVRNYETLPPKTYPVSSAVVPFDYKRDQAGNKADHYDRHAQYNVVKHQSSQEAYDYVRKLRPRPCHKYYLYGECRTQSCQFGHNYELDQLAYSALSKLTKEMVCPELQNGRCYRAENECIYGHRCPRGIKCQWGEDCWFAHIPDGHPDFKKSSH